MKKTLAGIVLSGALGLAGIIGSHASEPSADYYKADHYNHGGQEDSRPGQCTTLRGIFDYVILRNFGSISAEFTSCENVSGLPNKMVLVGYANKEELVRIIYVDQNKSMDLNGPNDSVTLTRNGETYIFERNGITFPDGSFSGIVFREGVLQYTSPEAVFIVNHSRSVLAAESVIYKEFYEKLYNTKPSRDVS